jgi:RNA polymerase primary sigma factor
MKTSKLSFTHAQELTYIMKQIDKYPLLTSLEQKDLLREYHENNNQNAKDKLVNHNLRLVINLLTKYQHKSIPVADLFQEGIFGLVRAIEKFDFKKNTNLSTYASIWIAQSIRRAIVNRGSLIRIPVHTQERRSSISIAKTKLSETLEREPTADEIADYLGISFNKVDRHLKENEVDINSMIALDAPVNPDGSSLMEILKSEDGTDDIISRKILKERLQQEIDQFNDQYKLIFQLRFGFIDGTPKTQLEICSFVNAVSSSKITRQRVHQILTAGLAKLRKTFADTELEECI